MKIIEYDGSVERQIVIGMIVDPKVVGRVAQSWIVGGLFASRWPNVVGGWCITYYKKYQRAPGLNVKNMFVAWAEKHTNDKDTIQLIESFLVSLSEEYETQTQSLNSDWILDKAGEHFNSVRLRRMGERILGHLDTGEVARAQETAQESKPIEIGVGSGVDVLSDEEASKSALTKRQEALFIYPGDMGRFLGDDLARDTFVVLAGPMKRGKSFFLIDFAWRAMLSRCRVAFIQAGDLTQDQMMRRFITRAVRRPLRPQKYKVPIAMKVVGSTPQVEFEERQTTDWVNWEFARDAFARVAEKGVKSKDSYLKLSCFPANTVTPSKLRAMVDGWILQNWSPDFLVLDYADLLASSIESSEHRDKVNDVWIQLSAIRQEYHCCVLSATQTNAESLKADTLGMHHYSNDIRKMAHVTGMIGINRNEEEIKAGVLRLNWIVRREDDATTNHSVYTAGALAMANPIILSSLPEFVPENGNHN